MTTSEDDNGPVATARDAAMKGIAQARKTATDVVIATKEKGEELIDDTREKSFRAAAETNRLFQEHPITAVAAAASVGAIIGIFLPRIALASRVTQVVGQAIKAVPAASVAQAALTHLATTPGKTVRAASKRLGVSDKAEAAKSKADEISDGASG